MKRKNKILMLSLIVFLIACAAFWWVWSCINVVHIDKMEYIIFPNNGREVVVSINDKSCKYCFGTLLLKDYPIEGTLFMKNGETFDICYIKAWNCFFIEGKHGYYLINRNE